jgi:glycosyltransferase involved in cell wall biosynthesis
VKRTLIVLGPLPPPVHGVAVSTQLVLANPRLQTTFDVEHVDTTDPRSISNMGRWDVVNVALGLRNLLDLVRRLRRPHGLVYLPLSETVGGFVRDSLFILAASVSGWRTAVHCRNSTFRDFYGSRNSLMKTWIRFTLRRIDAVAVLGESLRDLFAGLIPPDRIAVVPNGTPDSQASAEPIEKRVLYLSNLSRKKGADIAVNTAIRVLSRHPDAEFFFAGAWEDATFEREVRGLAETIDGRRIKFLPPVTGQEKEELLSSAWVLLFPVVRGEGHPRIVLEALAAGVPVVTTDRATIRDTVGGAGYVLPHPDPAELADRVCALVEEPALRQRLSREARQRYLERYTQEQADQRLAEWLARLVHAQ